jgi:hypothetical protein
MVPTTPGAPTADSILEVAAILAAGLMRLSSRKSSQNLPPLDESPLDCEGNSGGDVAAEIETFRP